MWFTILIIMIFIYVGLGIINRLIDIYKFFTNNYIDEKSKKKKLVK